MVDRYDIICAVKGRNDKSYWTKIGVAFPSKKGSGFSIFLDYIPVGRNDDGKLQLLMAEPKPFDDDKPKRSRSRDDDDDAPRGKGKQADMDDDIPFFWAAFVPWIGVAMGIVA